MEKVEFGKNRVVMGETKFKGKDWLQFGKQYMDNDSGEWRFKTSLLVPVEKKRELAQAMRNFADALDNE